MIRRPVLAVVLMALGLALTATVASAPAEAQGLLDRLFGGPSVAPSPVPPPQPSRRPGGLLDLLFGAPGAIAPPSDMPGSPPARVGPPPVAAAKVIPKDPNARKILVVGDFIAGGLAWGLDQTFAEEPRLAVVDPELTHSVPPGVTAATGTATLRSRGSGYSRMLRSAIGVKAR